MSVFKEFREFIARGNVIDLAVGVIIGAAFNGIVKSLVDEVVMPPIGLVLGKIDFSDLKWVLQPANAATKTAEVAIQYGAFINTVIQFVIVAWVVFLMVKGVNAIRRKDAAAPAPAEPPAPTPTEALLSEIRDLLKGEHPAPSAATASPAKAAPAAKPAARKAPARKKTS
ncbi:large conductance mechanosensitive channel [Caulobacter ginsengisoli]|uniref:Large-conductance mechanosensitive channel n=1 Tax=Caulobacter ginsengisoli TaxID=400775 RepID=A0ABU0IXV2_9CAUL|nr:large conductance mechanosensitive channel [Caulobacter ginsengisoli]